jgi:hypothetical protein
MSVDKTKRIGRWYFGGMASAMAACCTHPLDLMLWWKFYCVIIKVPEGTFLI